MDLSRRGVLGGLGVACGVGAVGLAGAASVGDTDGGDEAGGSGAASTDEGESSVPVDPDAPFLARLLSDDGGERRLFDAGDLDRVDGVYQKEGEHRVRALLSADGRETFRERLTDAGAVADPTPFDVVMTLDGETVRQIDLDEETVTGLTDEEWGGLLLFPFGDAADAESVYESLAAE